MSDNKEEVKNNSVVKPESGDNTNNKKSGKTVEVDSAILEDLLGRVKKMESENVELRQAQKDYESTASQDQILKIEKLRNSGKLVKSIRLNFYGNKMVVGWKSTHDDVYVDTTGKIIELQKTELTFDDKSSIEITQIEFARRKLQREYEVIKEGRDRDGNMIYTVLTDGGKEIEVDGRFVN